MPPNPRQEQKAAHIGIDSERPRWYHDPMVDNYALLDTIELAYGEAGSGPPLVMIHGLGGSRDDWTLQIEDFSTHYRLIRPELRGHGQSPRPPGPYRVELFAADVAMLMMRLEARPAHVVGLSLGGAVAMQLALDYPELVRSLTLVNTASHFISPDWRQRLMGVRRFAALYLGGMEKVAQDVAGRLFPLLEQAAIRSEAIARLTANDPVAYRNALWAVARFNVTDQLPSIACPALVVSGDRDYAVPLASKERLAECIPGCRLEVIGDSGHATPLDQAEAFNQVVLQFLESLEDSASAS